jgi:transcriptional regulator with XRE-family HTH domain
MAKGWQMATLPERLRQAMRDAGLDQKQTEERAGLSQGYVSSVLSGRRKHPRAHELGKLADALGTTTDWLLSGAGESRTTARAVPQGPAPDPEADVPSAFDVGLADAFRQGRYALDDLDAVRRLMREGRALFRDLPPEELARAAGLWLAAASELRVAGRPLTTETLAHWLALRASPGQAGAAAEAARRTNDRGDQELRALGVEPPPRKSRQ